MERVSIVKQGIAGGDTRAYGVATRLSQPPRWGCRATIRFALTAVTGRLRECIAIVR
jgi:hypothetical protein